MSSEENIPTESELAKRKETIISFLERLIRMDNETAKDFLSLLRSRISGDRAETLEEIDEVIIEVFVEAPLEIIELDLEQDEPIPAMLQSWMDQVSSQIINLRKTKNWTVADLAKQTNLSIDYLDSVEQGTHPPSNFALEKIASAFNVPAETFDP